MVDTTPLGQRQTGRRARRRQEKQENSVIGFTSSSSGSSSHNPTETDATSLYLTKREPSLATEQSIDARIEERRQRMKESASLRNDTAADPIVVGDYEYLDHTADIQLHGWGTSLERALEQTCLAMFGYMTDLQLVKINAEESQKWASNIVVTGTDVQNLVWSFLNEWLSVFHENGFVPMRITIAQTIDKSNLQATSSGDGEVVRWTRHSQGTEVKAVTYSHLQVKETDDRCDIWVIVDI